MTIIINPTNHYYPYECSESDQRFSCCNHPPTHHTYTHTHTHTLSLSLSLSHTHTHTHTQTHAYIVHTYIHTCMHTLTLVLYSKKLGYCTTATLQPSVIGVQLEFYVYGALMISDTFMRCSFVLMSIDLLVASLNHSSCLIMNAHEATNSSSCFHHHVLLLSFLFF